MKCKTYSEEDSVSNGCPMMDFCIVPMQKSCIHGKIWSNVRDGTHPAACIHFLNTRYSEFKCTLIFCAKHECFDLIFFTKRLLGLCERRLL